MAYYTAINAARNRPRGVGSAYRLGQHLLPFQTQSLGIGPDDISRRSSIVGLLVALQSVGDANPQQKRNRLEVITERRRHAVLASSDM